MNERGHGFKAKVITLIVALVLILITLAQNSGVVAFHFLFWSARVSQLLLVMIILVAGFAAGYVAALLRNRRGGGGRTPGGSMTP